jgi:hypothetical protein
MPSQPTSMTSNEGAWRMMEFDITKTNIAVERLRESTENARHRYLLAAYNRHRNLEMAGRYAEIFVPEMTVEHPIYRFSFIGQPPFKLDGRQEVEALYRAWTETDECVFYMEGETLAVSDNMIVSRAVLFQQQLGSSIADRGADDPNAMYLLKANIAMIWPYDDDGRLIGEDVWEYDDSDRDIIKLDPADVLTAEQAAKLLDPLITPLPPRPDAGI